MRTLGPRGATCGAALMSRPGIWRLQWSGTYSRRMRGCIASRSAFAPWGFFKQPSSRKSSRDVHGRGRGGRPLTLPQGILPQNWGETELNRTVTCMMLNATVNDRRTSSPLP
ncbi:hypothetical protein TNCV_1109491 [Trichonephila clavipes]|nr:hypothetical protein TNCV_1109491 [Trichonephila clavipes]